jgi:hypothetical protein
MENEKEVEIQESSFKLYLKCFEKLTAKERDILMDCLKLEITPIPIYKEPKCLEKLGMYREMCEKEEL